MPQQSLEEMLDRRTNEISKKSFSGILIVTTSHRMRQQNISSVFEPLQFEAADYRTHHDYSSLQNFYRFKSLLQRLIFMYLEYVSPITWLFMELGNFTESLSDHQEWSRSGIINIMMPLCFVRL